MAEKVSAPPELEHSVLFTTVAYHCGPPVLLTSPAVPPASETALMELLWLACGDEPVGTTEWREAMGAVGIPTAARGPTDTTAGWS